MAYNNYGGYTGSVGDSSSMGGNTAGGMQYQNNAQERLQDNLAKAFSLLDDEKPKVGGYDHGLGRN